MGTLDRRRVLAAGLVVLALVVACSLTARERGRITRLEEAVLEAFSPLEHAAYWVSHRVAAAVGSVAQLWSLREQNRRLKAELAQFEDVSQRLAEALEENSRLRRLLYLEQRLPFEGLAARVIGRNPDNWFRTLQIDRGRADGVSRDMPVVTAGGLVGRVVRVTARASTVMLITDPDSGVGVINRRSRYFGVALGQPGNPAYLNVTFFSRDADCRVGDVLVTSGLGGVFPSGLVVGLVERVERGGQGLLIVAQARPAADVDRLEEVLVLTAEAQPAPAPPKSSGPPLRGPGSPGLRP
ncbi:MAG: rod shape-determining protein MreC [Acetobacteraceae bacterium]|nr:rod shape-determining protein MreC [Acetobacteraceae bacterium]